MERGSREPKGGLPNIFEDCEKIFNVRALAYAVWDLSLTAFK